jgi:protein TonB
VSQAPARPGGSDFISATLLFSLLLHGVLILGITFHFVKTRPSLPTLDVTLVDVANREAPDRADFLAQANNQGGGQSDQAARPSQPVSGLLPKPVPGTAPQPVEAAMPRPQEATAQRLLTTTGASDFSVRSDSARQAQEDTQADADEARRQQQNEAYAKRPKKKFISANTKEYAYAAYMRGWVDRVERVGNLNYPDQARQRELHGELVLTVGLNRDGSINNIALIKSSGQPVLDHAAERIVRLSGPFPPLPADNQRVDQLFITRTWQFLPGNVLRNH